MLAYFVRLFCAVFNRDYVSAESTRESRRCDLAVSEIGRVFRSVVPSGLGR